jgi:hypothetical protein
MDEHYSMDMHMTAHVTLGAQHMNKKCVEIGRFAWFHLAHAMTLADPLSNFKLVLGVLVTTS